MLLALHGVNGPADPKAHGLGLSENVAASRKLQLRNEFHVFHSKERKPRSEIGQCTWTLVTTFFDREKVVAIAAGAEVCELLAKLRLTVKVVARQLHCSNALIKLLTAWIH